MADEKRKFESGVTPKGIAAYPRLTKPDTKFNADGEYKVTLLLKPGEAGVDAFITKLDKAYAQAVVEGKKEFSKDPKNKSKKFLEADKPYGPALDAEGNETGDVKVSFKMKAVVRPKGKDAWTQRPSLFDAKGKPLTDPKVGGGSTVKVSYEIIPFFTVKVGAGISLRLKAVQIIDLKEFGSKDAAGFGFGEEEGYSGDESDDTTTPPTTEGDGASGGKEPEEF